MSVESEMEKGIQTEETSSSSVIFPPIILDSSEPFSEEDASSGNESVMERLSRSMGMLFHRDRRDRGTQTAKDPMTSETERLAFDIVFFVLGKRAALSSDDEVVRCLRCAVLKMLEKHSLVFNGMMSRLRIGRGCNLHHGFKILADELFAEEHVSWGKIVALYAFAARLAQYCVEENMTNIVFDVATNLTEFAVDRLTPFLREHGGWATLCDAFPLQKDYETKIWRSLVITGMGLTAIATILALQK